MTSNAPAATPVADVAAKAQKEFAKAQKDAREKYCASGKAAKVERDLTIAQACIQFNEAMTPQAQ